MKSENENKNKRISKFLIHSEEIFAFFLKIIIFNALQNIHCGVKDNNNTEHEDNKAAWDSYKNVPGMSLLCEIPEIHIYLTI